MTVFHAACSLYGLWHMNEAADDSPSVREINDSRYRCGFSVENDFTRCLNPKPCGWLSLNKQRSADSQYITIQSTNSKL